MPEPAGSESAPSRDTSIATPRAGSATRLAVAALRRLPVHALSRLAGRAAAWRLPGPLQRAEIRAFGRLVGVDFSEVRDPIERFESLQHFFTRALKPGVRPIDSAPDAVVAPCDGFWGASGRVEGGTLLQVKGRPYSLAALLGDADQARRFEGGPFATFYLSPRDYHRFHMPCDATPVAARYRPGALFPVNAIGLAGVDGLFAQNERVVTTFELGAERSGGTLAIAAVGATLVGKVHVVFDDITTQADGTPRERHYDDLPLLRKGEEWGRFEFGSTLVLVAEASALSLEAEASGRPLRLGTRIGTLAG